MSAAAWFADRLHPFAQDVGSIMPGGYASYARVFHPAYRAFDEPVRWREIAEANGRRAHSEMQFGNIAGAWREPSPAPDLWSSPPRSGGAPPRPGSGGRPPRGGGPAFFLGAGPPPGPGSPNGRPRPFLARDLG